MGGRRGNGKNRYGTRMHGEVGEIGKGRGGILFQVHGSGVGWETEGVRTRRELGC